MSQTTNTMKENRKNEYKESCYVAKNEFQEK